MKMTGVKAAQERARRQAPDAGTMQDIPIDQGRATFTIEKQWPGHGRAVVPFGEVTFPK